MNRPVPGLFLLIVFSILNHYITKIPTQFLVEEEIFNLPALFSVLVTHTDLQLRELEVQRQIQLEKLKFEQERDVRIRLEHTVTDAGRN